MGDLRSVVDGLYLHPFGECGIDQRQFLFDGLDHFGGVGAASLQHHTEHRLFAVDGHGTKAWRLALFDLCNIADGNGKQAFAAYDSVADVIERLVETCTPDEVLFTVELEVLTSCRGVRAFECFDDFIVGRVGCLQAFGVDKYVVLLLETAPADDLFDTIDRFEQRCNGILL